MELEYGPEYEAFRGEVRAFLDAHGASAPKAGIGYAGGGSREATLAWQRKLIEHGYARARSRASTAATAPSRTS